MTADVSTTDLTDIRPPDASLARKLRRAFFATPTNAVITLVCVLGLVLALIPMLRWGVVNATWSGDGDACRANHDGACWAFIGAKLRLMVVGFYPAAESWRPIATLLLLCGMVSVTAFPRFWGKRLLASWILVFAVGFLLMYGGVFGLSVQTTRVWGGLPLTMILSVVCLAVSFPLGVLLALGRRSKMPVLRNFCVLYVELVRGVPLITVLFMASILFPLLMPAGTFIDKLLRAQVALILFASAYLAEAVRGGLQSLPKGQYEAATSLGLNYRITMLKVILPQAIKVAIPGLTNVAIGLFKDTSLVIIIGLMDFLTAVKAALNDPEWLGIHVEGYVFAAAVYFVFCFAFSRYSLWLEDRLNPDYR